ncbi:hypothetical protein HOY82DRAFT_589537 [Tuber indicum]|nr:hypothetical protein HOY82DRAFT_589537 [Tuber indicum]
MLRLERNFGIRGALARLLNKIWDSIWAGIQAGINELAKTPEFDEVFMAEVARRGLIPEDVASCVALVYHQASKFAHGNDSMIAIREKDHTVNQRAALAIILMVQSRWPDSLAWREAMEENEC